MDPKERRANPRQPIKLAAQLVVGQGESWPCQISDFCAEGLFIRYSADTARKLDRHHVRTGSDEVGVRFRGADGKSRHELTARIVRQMDGAIGVEFTRPNPQAVEAMLVQCGADRNQDRVSLKPPSERVQFVLRQCARTMVDHIEPLMDACFVQTAEALRQAAQTAGNDQ